MANSDRVKGFAPVRHVGSPWNGQVNRYVVRAADATAIFVGDLVKLDGGSDGKGVRSVTQSAAAGASIGVVVGVEPAATDLNTPQYRAASTLRYVYVVDDPHAYFVVQEDGNIGTAAVGLNCDVTIAAGNTTTGNSGMELDSSETNTTATLQLKIIEAVQSEDNDSTLTNAKWIVKINNHQLNSGTGSAGV